MAPRRLALLTAPKPSEVVSIELVTPDLAQEWLEGNVHNRQLRESRVVHLAGALARDEWELTGDAVVFDTLGQLLNGQHRLTAIVVANLPARMLVLRGIPTKTQEVMDQNLPRRLADALKLRGYDYWHQLAAALNFLHRLRYIEATGNVGYVDPGQRPTTPQCLALLEDNLEIVGYRSRVVPYNRTLRMRTGVTMATWYELGRISDADADAFYDVLLTGVGLTKMNPIWQLRHIMVNEMTTSRPRMRDFREAALIYKTWNYWRDGQQVRSLSWHFGGTRREAFPTPH